MIELKVTGTLPEVNLQAFKDATPEILAIMQGTIQRNFQEGGRPRRWAPAIGTPQGGTLLMRSGKMYGTIRSEVGENFVRLFTNDKIAAIQQSGARIPWTAKSRAYFWAVVAPRLGLVSTGKTGKGFINIPPRPFMLWQKDDPSKILEVLAKHLFTFTDVVTFTSSKPEAK